MVDKQTYWCELTFSTLKSKWPAFLLTPAISILAYLRLLNIQGSTHPILQSISFSLVGLFCLALCTAIAFSAYWDYPPLNKAVRLALPRLFRALLPGGLLILVTAITITYFVVDRVFEYSDPYPAWIWATITPWLLSTGIGFAFTPYACVYGDQHGSILERGKSLTSTLSPTFTSMLMFGSLMFAIYPVVFFLLMPFLACLMVAVFIDTARIDDVERI